MKEWPTAAFYWLTTRLVWLASHVFGRLEVRRDGDLPATGPAIVVSNHLNNADPPLIGSVLRRRRIRFMAKAELFRVPVGGFFIRLFGAFPVRRFEADLAALRTAQDLLARGKVIGMFPEGHRSHGRGLLQAQPGTALIALRSGAPLVPVALTGTEQVRSPLAFLHRPRATVTVGEPFVLPRPERIDSAAVRAATDEMMLRIARLLPPTYRGAYSEMVESAGRRAPAGGGGAGVTPGRVLHDEGPSRG